MAFCEFGSALATFLTVNLYILHKYLLSVIYCKLIRHLEISETFRQRRDILLAVVTTSYC